MTPQDHYLVIVMEKCAEVTREAAKCLRFGIDDINTETQKSNMGALVREFNDLVGGLELLYESGLEMPELFNREQIGDSKMKVKEWLTHSETKGRLSATTEVKKDEGKPAEAKKDETKPTEDKKDEAKPAEIKKDESKQTEAKDDETKPPERESGSYWVNSKGSGWVVANYSYGKWYFAGSDLEVDKADILEIDKNKLVRKD
jgi:hypothetical protein